MHFVYKEPEKFLLTIQPEAVKLYSKPLSDETFQCALLYIFKVGMLQAYLVRFISGELVLKLDEYSPELDLFAGRISI